MELAERVECRRCHMPFERRFVGSDGECVVCHEHLKKWMHRDYAAAERELEQILDHYRERNRDRKYDAIVAFSGGKDSVYALHLMKKRFGMRPLAVTADNGLLTERALRNMKRIVEQVGSDHVIVRRDPEELRSLYQAFFRKTRNFCEVCYLTITSSLGQAALEYDVPLLVTGFAFKIDSSHFRAAQRYCFEDAFVRTVRDEIPEEIYSTYVTKGVRSAQRFHLLHLFDYVNHLDEEIYQVLENEYGWDSAQRQDKHSDCRFHHMLGYLRWINNDLTSLALMTPAALLRDGQIDEEQFREMLDRDRDTFQNVDPAQLQDFLGYFGVEEEFLTTELAPVKLADSMIDADAFEAITETRRHPLTTDRQLVDMLIAIVRPEVQRDGGDIEVLGFSDGRLQVQLTGACRGCMIGDQVMMRYLESLVRKYISPDIVIDHVKTLSPPADSVVRIRPSRRIEA